MRLLVDTQVFIWIINNDKRLGPRALDMLLDTSNQVFISYFSFFEIIIKASVGKLTYDNTILKDLPKMGIDLIMPDENTLQNYTIYNPSNKDPFDNILITVARNEKCTFITSDPKILTISMNDFYLFDAQK